MLSDIARQGRTGVLVVDQSITTLASVCDRMYVLKDGSVTELEPHRESLHELQEVYF